MPRRIETAATLFVIEPDALSRGEVAAAVRFVEAGGRLVVGGSYPGRYLGDLGADPPRWELDAPRTWTEVDASLAPVGEVEASGRGAWADLGSSAALVGEAGGARSLLSVAEVGGGEILYLADPEPLENEGLGVADNAALALSLAGDEGRPVVFAEGVHGFGSSSGWAAIPEAWKLSLGGLTAAALVFMWARGNRLGPAERESRPLPPPRREHVEALAAALARHGIARRAGRSVAGCGTTPPGGARRARPERPRRRPRQGRDLGGARRSRAAGDVGVGRDRGRPARSRPGAGPVERARRRWSTVKELRERVVREVRKVVVGQDHVVDVLLAATSVGGHVLLEGVPGVAKTLVAHVYARAIGIEFRRVQFTPDMLPSDLTGTMTLRPAGAGADAVVGEGDLAFRRGPVFTNLLLADEINRTPPKTQSALLEAMQEHQVSIDGVSHPLPDPFVVVATQNPIEYEGTYPLPEAQLDRFLAKVDVGYPSERDEVAILRLGHRGVSPATLDDVVAVASAADLLAAREEVDATTASDEVAEFTVALVRRTRELPSVALGASPRAAVHLLAAARSAARLVDRSFVIPDDVVSVAPAVLRHRLLMRPEAELERFTPDDAIRIAIGSVPVPR